MACCLTAPRHNLIQYLHTIFKHLQHSLEGHFTRLTLMTSITMMYFTIEHLKSQLHLLGANELKPVVAVFTPQYYWTNQINNNNSQLTTAAIVPLQLITHDATVFGPLNTLSTEQNGRCFADATSNTFCRRHFKYISFKRNSCILIKTSLKFVLRLQLTIHQFGSSDHLSTDRW